MSEPQKETATTTTQAVVKKDRGEVEFIPFGGKDKIKLSISIVQRLICVPTKSGKKCSDDDAIKFIAMCQAKHLNPFEGDCYMIGYDTQDGPQFSQITAHQVYLKRSEASKEYDGMQSGIIVREKDGTIKEIEGDFHLPDQVILGGWARVFMKDREHPTYRRVRLERFRKNTAIWRDDPAGMICKCFDPLTEVLTDRGFEHFCTAEGRILQVTDNGLEPTDSVPFSRPYSGDMVLHTSRNGQFMVTPNHDLPLNGGKVEARWLTLMKQRDDAIMPMAIIGSRPPAPIHNESIMLAAAYLADGSDNSKSSGFSIAVSRPKKVQLLRSINLHRSEKQRVCAGDSVTSTSGRVITTRADKRVFYYSRNFEIDWLVGRGKRVNITNLMSLSMDQSRLFIETWMAMDGNKPDTLTAGRIYTSRLDHCSAIELSAVMAGLSVSMRTVRKSDIGGYNYTMTLTKRQSVNIDRSNVSVVTNGMGEVWCVTVPTHKIVVRREGFSHVCYQCAEADALRSTFPTLLGGLYMREEVEAGNQFAAPKFEDKGRLQSFLVAPDDIKVEHQAESAYNPVKAMRKLLQADKIPEETFVGFLANGGVIEDDIKTLEDIQERRPEVMALLAGEKYSEVKGQIKALTTPQSEPEQKKGE